MSKISNDGLTQPGLAQDACFRAVPIPYDNSGRQRVKITEKTTRITVARKKWSRVREAVYKIRQHELYGGPLYGKKYPAQLL